MSGEFKFLRTYPCRADVCRSHRLLLLLRRRRAWSRPRTLLSGSSDKLFYRRVSDLFTGRKAKGANLVLTINAKAQEAAYDALGDQRGAAVALNPKTGEILAMVSKPSYDRTRSPRMTWRRSTQA